MFTDSARVKSPSRRGRMLNWAAVFEELFTAEHTTGTPPGTNYTRHRVYVSFHICNKRRPAHGCKYDASDLVELKINQVKASATQTLNLRGHFLWF